METITDSLGRLGEGLLLTLALTGAAWAGALFLGVLLAVFRVVPVRPLRAFGAVYVGMFRNIPLLVLLVLFVFGLPEVGLLYPLFATVALAMALYWSAFVCEVVRSGILAVPAGQADAARALGMTGGQSLGRVILPQAVRSMVQPLGALFIGVVLSTSLAAAVGVPELTGQAQLLTLQYDEPLLDFAATTVLYVAITLSAGLCTSVAERRLVIAR